MFGKRILSLFAVMESEPMRELEMMRINTTVVDAALRVLCISGLLVLAGEVSLAAGKPAGVAVREERDCPEFGEMVKIKVDGKPLTLNGSNFAAPLVTDWDGDGKKDLLIGEFAGHMTDGDWKGKIRFYSNTGTDACPEFGKYRYLEAGGKVITVNQY